MELDPQLFYALFSFLQVVVVGGVGWILVSMIKMMNRMTKVETLLETSLIEDIKDLKTRLRVVENKCNQCKL